jgi:hypothetical protein
MTTMTSAEQLILEMINRARMDPDGEAARLAQTHPGFTLNEGLAAGTISSTPKQVLAGNNTLAGVADNHNAAMLSSHVLDNNSLNPHTQAGDGSEVTRIANAGYQETYPAFQTYHDENIAWQGTSGAIDLASMTQQVEDGLFVDSYDSTRLHRVAIMDGTMREVGVGETTGVVQGYNSVVVTEDFGISGTNSFLTGAVYNDVNGNNFYDLNEGVQGVTATVTTTAGALVGSDTTGSGGGWSVSEPGGTYNVTFTGAGIVAGGVMATVAGGNLNAKVDLVNGNAIFSNVNTTLGAGATDLHLLGIGNINGTGNAANNVFYGTKGNNVFDGGLGSDTVVYSGTMASYGIAQNADGSITVTGPDGTDTLISIEKIQFKDQAYTPPNTNPGSVSINDAQIVEGNNGTQLLNFTVTRSGGTAAFDVNYATSDGTATVADNDYVGVPTTALHFNAGDTTKTVSVTINGDTKVEGNESFNVNLTGATNGATISKGVGIGIITNDDVAPVAGSVSINDAQIVEGNSGTQLLNFTVTRSGGTAAFDVNYATQDGTATVADNDYVNVPTTALHFNAGDTTKTVSVTINGDTKVEGNESFNVNLTGATNGATISKGVGVGIITNDDVAIVDTPPTVTASNITASRGQSFAASSLFTAKDADGDTISKYAFWDTGTNGGHFVLNGVAQGVSQEIDVTAAQLSQLSYQSGSGADTLWVAAYDGKQWGNWSNSFTVTGQADTAPTVTASNVTASRGQSFAASSLFMARDADGDAITKYAFWDTGAGGGHFVLNGVAQGVSQEIDVTAAQLSQLSYQSGTAADTLWVAAYDGTMWGNWSNSFTVTGQPDTAPTVTASNVTAAHGQSFAASSLFTARDADGDAITKYAFWDTGTGGGHFVLNGVAQGVGQEIDVTAAQLSQLSYQSGSGADTLWVAAYDGTMWGNWSNSFSVTAPIDTAPTVTTSNVTAAHGQSFAASSLFTARDADGDAITKYAFWDAGSGGGHLVLNGVAQGVNQEIDVTAAQLSQLSYQSGSGADTLWVAAYDGTTWGNSSSSFSVTAPIDSGPTVTPTNSEIKSFANQNFAASSLFSYSDPFGSPATQYDFWNTGGGGGHFVLNGTALGANQHNIISATQLGQLSYQVGTGSDTIWVGANDGTVWGGWSKGFTISDPPAVAAGETITLGSGFAGQVDFLSDTGTLKLENSSSFAGTVAGLCGQDAIDFADIGFGANSTLGYAANSDHSGGTLSVGDGTHMANIALLGSYMASTFVAASDGHGGTLISEAAHASTQMPVVTQPHA